MAFFLKLSYSKVRASFTIDLIGYVVYKIYAFTYLAGAAIFSWCLLRVQCFVYSSLHVCLRVSIAFNYYFRLAHGLMMSGFACVYVVLYLLNFSASNNLYCYRHCGCPGSRVCVSVRSFLPPRASISRNIGTYVFTATRKILYIGIIIWKCFVQKLRQASFACPECH